jgi:hypothetical protein
MPKQYPATLARKQLYVRLRVACTWAAKKWPTWCDEDYRQVLCNFGAQVVNGKYSGTTMTEPQLKNAMKYFYQKGFRLQPKKVDPKKSPGDWRKPRIAKLNAMWCELADDGHVEDRSQSAMEAWCKNNVPGLSRLQWTDSGELNKAVEMLKGFCRRCRVDVNS